jgi:iron complex outermembrane recepter protein
VKIETPHDVLTMTAAWFDTLRQNVQSSLTDPSTTPATTLVVFNNQVTSGFETDIVVKPTDHWKIYANATWQRAYLTDNPSQPAALWHQPQGVPRKLLNIFTTYDVRIANIDGFRIGAGMQARDKIYADALNSLAVPGWIVFDASFGYYKPNYDVSVGVKNIANATYYVVANGSGGFVGEGRTIYAMASARF